MASAYGDKIVAFVITPLLILATLVASGNAEDEPSTILRKLRKDLMSGYDKFARPIKNASMPVQVRIQTVYLEIAELSEVEERMLVNAVMIMVWKDEHLRWEPDQYNGIASMVFPESDIWRPDIIMHNSAPITEHLPWNQTNVIVSSNGWVWWYPPASISIRCPMSLLKPTDEQLCNISMGSYSHYAHELNLMLFWEGMHFEVDMNANPVWERTNVTASLRTTRYGTLEYSDVTFTVRLKRRYDFIGAVVRGPRTVAILLTLSMFWLPSTSDKKLNLGCLVLLVLSGVIMYLSSTVGSPPLLAATVTPLRIILFTCASALLVEVVVLNLSRLSDIVKPSPVLIRVLKGVVGRVIGVCHRAECLREESATVNLPEIGEEVSPQDTVTVEEEWSLVAMALDRVLFIIYSIIFIAVS